MFYIPQMIYIYNVNFYFHILNRDPVIIHPGNCTNIQLFIYCKGKNKPDISASDT